MALKFSIFKDYRNLYTETSTRADGNMRLNSGNIKGLNGTIKNNRRLFFERTNTNPKMVVSPVLEHGANIAPVRQKDAGSIIPNADGLITNQQNIFLALTVADCLPVFIFDPKQKAIALVHAGWRGMANGILDNTIKKFSKDFGSRPENLLVGIGPGICQSHYEVGDEVSQKFAGYTEATVLKGARKFLDLKLAARINLSRLAVRPENIETNPDCTFELPDKYFSYRRDRSRQTEAMMAVFGMERRRN